MRGWRAREREWERESERLGRKEHQQLSWDGASHRVGTSESQFLGLCTVAISGRSIPCSSQDWPPIGRRATVPSRDFQELGEGGGERHPAGLICGALAKESPHFIGVYKVMSNKQQSSYPRAAVRMSALSSQRLFGRSCCRHALLPVTQPCAQWGGQESSSHWVHPWFSNRAKVAQLPYLGSSSAPLPPPARSSSLPPPPPNPSQQLFVHFPHQSWLRCGAVFPDARLGLFC